MLVVTNSSSVGASSCSNSSGSIRMLSTCCGSILALAIAEVVVVDIVSVATLEIAFP